MKSGILVQHGHSPIKRSGEVRSDILAIIGFISEELWPEDVRQFDATGKERIATDVSSYETEMGDFVEMLLFREGDLYVHPYFSALDVRPGVTNFFVKMKTGSSFWTLLYNR